MELLKSAGSLDIVHIPYKGGAPAVSDLIAGQIDVMFAALPEATPHIRSGRLRALAISSSKRSTLLPDVPTVAEAGVAGFEAIGWQGLLAPAATPREVIDRIHRTLSEGLQQPQARKSVDAMGLTFSGAGPEAFGPFLATELSKWAKVVASSGVRLD